MNPMVKFRSALEYLVKTPQTKTPDKKQGGIERKLNFPGRVNAALPHLERAGEWELKQEFPSVHSSAQGTSGSPGEFRTSWNC